MSELLARASVPFVLALNNEFSAVPTRSGGGTSAAVDKKCPQNDQPLTTIEEAREEAVDHGSCSSSSAVVSAALAGMRSVAAVEGKTLGVIHVTPRVGHAYASAAAVVGTGEASVPKQKSAVAATGFVPSMADHVVVFGAQV